MAVPPLVWGVFRTNIRCSHQVASIIWSFCNHFEPDSSKEIYSKETLGHALASKDPEELARYYQRVQTVVNTFRSIPKEHALVQLLTEEFDREDPDLLSSLDRFHEVAKLFGKPITTKRLQVMLCGLNSFSLNIINVYISSPQAKRIRQSLNCEIDRVKHFVHTIRFCFTPEDFQVFDECDLSLEEGVIFDNMTSEDEFEMARPFSHRLFSTIAHYEQERLEYLVPNQPSTLDLTTCCTLSVKEKIAAIDAVTASSLKTHAAAPSNENSSSNRSRKWDVVKTSIGFRS